MADGLALDFPGGAQLAAALRELPEAVRGEILATALVQGALPIRDDAVTRASVRRWPRRRPEKPPLAETIRTTIERIGREEAVVDVGSSSSIAHLVELGHELVRGNRVVGHVAAYPFLRPAFDGGVEEAVAEIGASLGGEIEAAFRRLAPHEAE